MKSIVFISFLFLMSCSSIKESTRQSNPSIKEKPEVYIFDDIEEVEDNKENIETNLDTVESTQIKEEKIDTISIPTENEIITEKKSIVNKELKNSGKYIIQVGAFSTKKRAQSFINDNQYKIKWELTIEWNKKRNLYLVKLLPFMNRVDAEQVRGELWKTIIFKDAFIIPLKD